MANRKHTPALAREILESQQAVLHAPVAQVHDQAMITAVGAAGAWVGVVDRAPVTDKVRLMHALYQACAFPAYFGFNWDALVDCLSDLKLANLHVLLLRGSAQLPAEDLVTLQSVVESADERMRERGRRVRLVLGS